MGLKENKGVDQEERGFQHCEATIVQLKKKKKRRGASTQTVEHGTSLVVQRLRLHAPNAGGWVQFLVRN